MLGATARYQRTPRPYWPRSTHAMEDAMARRKLSSNSVSRVELDHRARDARIRLFRIERLFLPRAAAGSWLGSVVRLLGFRAYGNGRQGNRTRGSLSNRQRGCMPHDTCASCEMANPL